MDLRNYEVWPGNHSWWLKGKYVSGKNPYGLIASFLLFNATNTVCLIQNWIPHVINDLNFLQLVIGGIMWVSVDVFLLAAACTDPGFIPRQPEDYHTKKHPFQFQNWLVRDGLPGDQSHLLQIKYCSTCEIMRPKRAIHCSVCNTCISQMDHHCPFISTCVGQRNYTYFFFFCVSLVFDSLFVVLTTIIDLQSKIQEFGSFTEA